MYPAAGSYKMLVSLNRTTRRQVAGAHLISSVSKYFGPPIMFSIQRCEHLLSSSLRTKLFLLLCLCTLIVCMLCSELFWFHRANWHSLITLTEDFPCFFLSCNANARVYLAKTGHVPHASKLVNCVVLCIVCVDCVVLCIVCVDCVVLCNVCV